ncbi:MAG: hypothetical protein HC802_11900 [Caldilineaceae bacterium]|nr:hypothetical protein [Caldilineaceae bacterium]
MTITLSLPPLLEEQLAEEAKLEGFPPSTYAQRILEEYLQKKTRRNQGVVLLQSWIDDDDGTEQEETGDYLVEALDEDRLSERKHFPPDLEGITW